MTLPALTVAVLLATTGANTPSATQASAVPPPLPVTLSATGLFRDGVPSRTDPRHIAFEPRFPLWSDGTRKQRWLSLPAGMSMDGRDPDAWQFPPGTRLWKTFAYRQPVETRMIERLGDGSWRFSAYVWDADGRDAALAPAEGVAELVVSEAPGGRYQIPSREDCLACHGGAATPVLGLSTVQQADLATLVRDGHLTGLPPAALTPPPAIEPALGYLHGNCGHCHNRSGRGVPVALNLSLQWRDGVLDTETILRSALGRKARYAAAGAAPGTLVVAGDAAASLIPQRMRSREPLLQMPPLGNRTVDAQGLALVEHWIATMPKKETPP